MHRQLFPGYNQYVLQELRFERGGSAVEFLTADVGIALCDLG
jgi:hypothetical protein